MFIKVINLIGIEHLILMSVWPTSRKRAESFMETVGALRSEPLSES